MERLNCLMCMIFMVRWYFIVRNFINDLHTHESRKTFERNNAVQDVMLFSPPPP